MERKFQVHWEFNSITWVLEKWKQPVLRHPSLSSRLPHWLTFRKVRSWFECTELGLWKIFQRQLFNSPKAQHRIIDEEYYCQMRRIMIGKSWNIKQMHQRKIVNIICCIILSKYVQSCTINCKGAKTTLCMCLGRSIRGNIYMWPIINK